MIPSGKAYHQATGYDRYRMNGHVLDWAHPPVLYKTYPGIPAIGLPQASPCPRIPLWRLAAGKDPISQPSEADFELLSRICVLSYGVTAKSGGSGHEFYFRSAASAGALYPCELYLAAVGVRELGDGIYHYGVHPQGLTPLRSGDFRSVTQSAVNAPEPFSLCFFITGIFFRSAWKYRKRALRYVLLDAGHLLENLILSLTSAHLRASVHYDFDDRALEDLLGVEKKQEGVLTCVAVHCESSPRPVNTAPAWDPLPESIRAAGRVSEKETSYAEIESLYLHSRSLPAPDREAPDLLQNLGPVSEAWADIDPVEPIPMDLPYPDALIHRRSKRNFIAHPLPADRFGRLLNLLVDSMRRDPPFGHRYGSAVATGFLAGDIHGIEPGFYLIDPIHRKIGRLFKGYFLSRMASACLDQDWLKNASLHFLFLTNLDIIDQTWGPRSYRYAMLTAGRLGQMIYTGATAQGLGCCGIGALYDGEAKALLRLNESSALLYLVAVGAVKRF